MTIFIESKQVNDIVDIHGSSFFEKVFNYYRNIRSLYHNNKYLNKFRKKDILGKIKKLNETNQLDLI